MSFTGKATYSAGSDLPEIAEDVSDLVSIAAGHETPLLDALGDARRSARSTVHEWLEDALLPNHDSIDDEPDNPSTDTALSVVTPDVFRPGDQVMVEAKGEIMLVTAVDAGGGTITVTRGYGGSTAASLAADDALRIIGNAAMEGADADTARFTSRARQTNYTQIFTSTVEVSGSELAVRQLAVADEMDYQKQQRTRELLRDLENSVINGRAAGSNPQGNATTRRTMRGIVGFLSTHVMKVGVDGFPSDAALTEKQLNLALRRIWSDAGGQVDLIVVGGQEKRAINGFIATNRRYGPDSESYKDAVSVYESDFGVCRIVLSRWVPKGAVLLLDSSRVEVLPLAGRSFQFQPLARTGDRESGQMVGEYTLELRNEAMHGMITGFTS